MKIAGISSKKLGDANNYEGYLDNKNLYNDKELIDEGDLDWYDYGFRNYDAQIGRFVQVDPLTDDYPELTNYLYAFNDPIANIDVDGLFGGEIVKIGGVVHKAVGPGGQLLGGIGKAASIASIGVNVAKIGIGISLGFGGESSTPQGIFLVFDGMENKLSIYSDNGTDDSYDDDTEVGVYDAYNNVDSRSKGKWEDGIYDMEDQTSRHTHGNATDKNGIVEDSPDGGYGSGGIYRAKPFNETTGRHNWRGGMAVHAGRLHYTRGPLKGQIKPLSLRVTMGCIRTTRSGMIGIDDAIKKYGRLKKIIVKNNRPSANSSNVKNISFGKRYNVNSNLFSTFSDWLRRTFGKKN